MKIHSMNIFSCTTQIRGWLVVMQLRSGSVFEVDLVRLMPVCVLACLSSLQGYLVSGVRPV